MRYALRNTLRSSRTWIILELAFCALLATPAMLALAASPPSTFSVDIAKFAYAPKDIDIAPGTKVIWTNRDQTPHTVTSNDKGFASKGLDTDDKFEHTFSSVGDFSYICTVHPFMTGVVHVHKQ